MIDYVTLDYPWYIYRAENIEMVIAVAAFTNR